MRRQLLLVLLILGLALPARAAHLESHIGPGEPARDFPADFVTLLPEDAQSVATTTTPAWSDPHVGGWGGSECPEGRPPRRPVIFVHGNSVDGTFWRTVESGDGTIVDVRQRFLDAGYCERELWAISYTGSTGYTTYNDINTKEVYAFIEAVRKYTHAIKVDVVAHSLGVTVVRKTAFEQRKLYRRMANFVAIAGANQGTTSCRGSGTAHVSHVCEEVEPGSAWLAELNGIGQTPPGPNYLTILDGSGTTDNFYLGPDALSPELEGACNHHMPGTPHNTLARGQAAVEIYLKFLIDGALPECAGAEAIVDRRWAPPA